jgi:hypothetical protein
MSTQQGAFSVRVIDERGRPCKGIDVQCLYEHSGTQTEYTDSDGWAEFPVYVGFGGTKFVTSICVSWKKVSEGTGFFPEDGDTFSYVRP